jgi:hypothetical protein
MVGHNEEWKAYRGSKTALSLVAFYADCRHEVLVVNWAKKVRLVRKQGTRLVPVAKARPVLADAEVLWQRAFEATFDLGAAVCRPIWADEPPSPVRLLYDVIVPDVLAAIYSMDEPVWNCWRSRGLTWLGSSLRSCPAPSGRMWSVPCVTPAIRRARRLRTSVSSSRNRYSALPPGRA